ncbi:ORF6N domain-containing protein [Candidatus Saccharibacteria bacterium]|nr:ORF6N domain-containing protein [Candidatus Saccharibacteria bacterium]
MAKTNQDSKKAKDGLIIEEGMLRDKIYVIRGQKVMLDYDLAEIYGYTTSAFNQQVKNNLEKFEGEDFMFRLTRDEVEYFVKSKNLTTTENNYRGQSNLRSKNLISSWGGVRFSPRAFTEQGIYMLMTVLRGPLAVKQSRALIRMFKAMCCREKPRADARGFMKFS